MWIYLKYRQLIDNFIILESKIIPEIKMKLELNIRTTFVKFYKDCVMSMLACELTLLKSVSKDHNILILKTLCTE